MSSPRRRILHWIAGGCAVAAALTMLTIPFAPDSLLPLAMRWSPFAVIGLLILAGAFARVASWQPASSSPPAAAPRREVLALTAAPHRPRGNERPVRAVRAGQRRNELPAGVRPVRAALPAAPERVS